jgi:transposase-like protein
MQKRQSRPDSFKKDAVRQLLARGSKPVSQVAKELGVSSSMLHRWRERFEPESHQRSDSQELPWPAPGAMWYNAHMAEADRLSDEALQLNSQQRSELAPRLLDTLEETDDEVDGAWRAAARERLASLHSGAAKGVPWDETRRRLLSR